MGMNTFLIIIGILAGLVILLFLKNNAKRRKHSKERFERVQPLLERLDNGEAIDQSIVLPYAADFKTRQLTYELLTDFGKPDLFPREYYTLIKGAESQLANWLEFPTELDAFPDEIEYSKRVSIDFDGEGNFVHYEVFKYRVNEPHWAASNGWMLGVVGPYFDDSNPYDHACFTFSRTSSTVDKVSPEEEVKWVHENIPRIR